MRFVFYTSLSDDVKEFINQGTGSYPIAKGMYHVHIEGGKTYVAYEVGGLATWHVVINVMGEPIKAIEATV
jgi:hypothetical protein